MNRRSLRMNHMNLENEQKMEKRESWNHLKYHPRPWTIVCPHLDPWNWAKENERWGMGRLLLVLAKAWIKREQIIERTARYKSGSQQVQHVWLVLGGRLRIELPAKLLSGTGSIGDQMSCGGGASEETHGSGWESQDARKLEGRMRMVRNRFFFWPCCGIDLGPDINASGWASGE